MKVPATRKTESLFRSSDDCRRFVSYAESLERKMRFTRTTRLGTLLLGLLAGAGAAAPYAAAEQGDGWDFEFSPYVFFSALEGTAGTRGIKVKVDESFSDVWDNLDIGVMGLFVARKGPWTLMFDGAYLAVEDQASRTVTGPGGLVTVKGALDVSSSFTVLQPSVLYRVLDDRTVVDLGVGLRYMRVALDLDVKIVTNPPIDLPSGGRSLDGSESWIDVVAVGRVTQPLSDRWSLVGYADVGGGGSSLTYQLVAGANWSVSERFTVKVGYRHAYWDYENDGVVWDMTASGPFLGFGIAF